MYKICFRFAYVNKSDIIYENTKFQGDVFYQIFPERFAAGNKNKDYVTREWNSLDLKNNPFLGGDIKGIINKLDYIKDLGIDTIYFTPLTESGSNHKYDVIDYMKIDKQFGTNKEFKLLVDKAHEKGMKICIDLVFNHIGYNNKIFQDVVKKGKKSKYANWFFIDGEQPVQKPLNYKAFADFYGMPKLDTNNPEVMDYMIKVGKFWIEKFGVDAYRLDVANEVAHSAWQAFKKAIIKSDPKVILIGECWHNSANYLSNAEWESTMNYPFTNACENFYVNNTLEPKQFVDKLNGLLHRYTENNNRMMLNLLDSHDAPRFYTLLNKDKSKYLLAILTMIFYIGYPMIYYGNEIFMEGMGDPDNRRAMDWESKEFHTKEHELFKDIVKLRKNDILRKGDIKIYNEENLVVIERIIGKNTIKAIINNTEKSITKKYKKVLLQNNFDNGVFKPYSFIVVN